MDEIDLEKFRVLSGAKSKSTTTHEPVKRHQRGEKYLAAIPWEWVSTAACLPGHAIQVALAIWFLKSVNRSNTVHLGGTALRELGVERQAGYRALKYLERAGLIRCEHARGRRPVVTVLEVPRKLNGNGKESSMAGEN
jgi:hypothetical protein